MHTKLREVVNPPESDRKLTRGRLPTFPSIYCPKCKEDLIGFIEMTYSFSLLCLQLLYQKSCFDPKLRRWFRIGKNF